MKNMRNNRIARELNTNSKYNNNNNNNTFLQREMLLIIVMYELFSILIDNE